MTKLAVLISRKVPESIAIPSTAREAETIAARTIMVFLSSLTKFNFLVSLGSNGAF